MGTFQDRETTLKLVEQMQGMTPAQLSVGYWGLGYQYKMTSGCPPDSNPHLAERARSKISELDAADIILDLGSGRQYLPSLLFGMPTRLPPKNRITTLDLTPIDSSNLSRNPLVNHLRADGKKLPFKNDSIGLLMSNMAVDYMQDSTAVDKEMFRVLQPGRSAILTLMRPSMFATTLDSEQILNHLESVNDVQDYLLARYLVDNQVLTNSDQEVRQRFMKQGFEIADLIHRVAGNENPETASPYRSSWWEVEIKKPELT